MGRWEGFFAWGGGGGLGPMKITRKHFGGCKPCSHFELCTLEPPMATRTDACVGSHSKSDAKIDVYSASDLQYSTAVFSAWGGGDDLMDFG